MITDQQIGKAGSGPPPVTTATRSTSRLRGRLILLAIVTIGLLPLVAALYFRYVSPPGIGMIVGQPLEPVPLPFKYLQRWDGTVLEHPQVSGKWLMIFAAPAGCDARCRHTLYLTRQARTAQGRHVTRIERLWVITDGKAPAADLMTAHPDLVVIKATDAKLLQLLGGSESRQINLVDRRGLLVFRYSDDPDAKAFIRELERLIRF